MRKYVCIKHRPSTDKQPSAFNLAHNSRLNEPTYLLEKEDRLPNHQSHQISNANKTLEDWQNEARELYKNKHNRQVRSDAVLVEESLISLSDEQVRNCDDKEVWRAINASIEDFEKRNKTKVYHIAWHRDEGHYDDNGEAKRNEHVHFLWRNVNDDGDVIRRQWKREDVKADQAHFAKHFYHLGFERGVDYQAIGAKAPKSKHHRIFKIEANEKSMVKKAKEYVSSQQLQIDHYKAQHKKLLQDQEYLRRELEESDRHSSEVKKKYREELAKLHEEYKELENKYYWVKNKLIEKEDKTEIGGHSY